MNEAGEWSQIRRAASAAGVVVRPLDTLEDADRILEVMIATWGGHQLLPRELIRALMDSGNRPVGAFDGARMVGYALGFLAYDQDGPHLHSHMLAVLPDHRSKGIGYALKLGQRAAALEHGIRCVKWTFDPLLSRNAHFNIAKLGAVCDRFHRDFYGPMSDPLNRGDRTDRFVVRWDVAAHGAGSAVEEGAVILDREGPGELPRPVMCGRPAVGPALVRIPSEYLDVRERDQGLASAWRDACAEAIEACMAVGLRATGFTAGSAYVFT
ncbi:MAG: GNAT family N-acetyltransferase [Actinomycetota bacterium]